LPGAPSSATFAGSCQCGVRHFQRHSSVSPPFLPLPTWIGSVAFRWLASLRILAAGLIPTPSPFLSLFSFFFQNTQVSGTTPVRRNWSAGGVRVFSWSSLPFLQFLSREDVEHWHCISIQASWAPSCTAAQRPPFFLSDEALSVRTIPRSLAHIFSAPESASRPRTLATTS